MTLLSGILALYKGFLRGQRYFIDILPIYEYGSIYYEKRSIMGYEILSSDFSDFVSTTEAIDTSFHGENMTQINIAGQKGDIHYSEQVLRQHLTIQEGFYHMKDDVRISGMGDSSLLEIQINLSDKAIFYQDKSRVEHVTPPKSGNIVFLSAEENQANILFQKDISYHTFDIHLPLTLLDQYAGESRLMDGFLAQIHKDTSSMLIQNKVSITPAIYNAVQDMKTCRYEGLTRRIYLESKVYEIIALLYESVEHPRKNYDLNAEDQEKIKLAASIIQNNLERPCSIIDLARQVGVNQTKLKTGFKTMFDNTIFGYLQNIRMHHAKRYLLDTQMSIQDIAMLLGYQNASNFSIAFKKMHGYPPVKLREK